MQEKPIFPNSEADESSSEASQEMPSGTMQLCTGARCEWPISRRDFVKGTTGVLGASLLAPIIVPSLLEAQTPLPAVKHVPVSLTINGEHRQMTIDARTSLLDLLRENLKLTGTKKGCDHGQCGACTVLVEGRRINSCLALAVSHDGQELTTIEGLAKGDVLDPVQQAFLDHDGFQCGYCTPGQIISAVALLGEARKGAASFVTADLRKSGPANLTDDEIRERMSGNICRCGAYPGIVAAVQQAYATSKESSEDKHAKGEAHAAL
jgi:xanthine dehydrogenase YagT iron-sulfur-binding subunit